MGQISKTKSISAGLDYPGVGPEHAFLKDSGRAKYVAVTDKQALEAFFDAHVVLDLNHHPDQEVAINNGTPNVLTVSGGLLRERPDLVARYLAQVLRAAYWARNHRAEAGVIFAREVSAVEEWLPEAFDESLYENLLPTLDDRLVHALEVRKDFLLKHGYLRKDFSVADWIDPKPLAAAHELNRSRPVLKAA